MTDSQQATVSLTGLVKGRVQGVFFRAETQAQATRLGLGGWVRNTSEGHVEVLISGPACKVLEMQAWLEAGPPRARVDKLELVACEAAPGPVFEIRY